LSLLAAHSIIEVSERENDMKGALSTAAVVTLIALAGSAAAQESIKIGEINSYTAIAAFTLPYRNGWMLAVEEINAAGGVMGRKLEVISRDDGGKPEDAVRIAGELVGNEKVVLLAGTFLSNVGLAVADFANQNKTLFVAAEPLTDAIVWEKGSHYVFRLRPSTYMQAAMLADEAAKLPAKRWATIAPNYEYGTSFVANFKKLLSLKRPDVQFVGEQWPANQKLDAGPTVDALIEMKPQAIFSAEFGGDLIKLVREGTTRGLFKDRAVVSALSGEPEYLDPLKDEAPTGWIVTGYPWYAIDTPEHKKFLEAYQKRFNDYPRLGSVVGYSTFKSIAAALAKAGSTDTEKLITAFKGLKVDSPFGPFTYRASDHQATMGAFVGKIALENGKGTMSDFKFVDGATVLPGDDEVKKLRPAAD
jgi:branched-chain amino acid transport system substrate-binding protein